MKALKSTSSASTLPAALCESRKEGAFQVLSLLALLVQKDKY
jgi:hypothetical protein